jgi:hypothetical protein
MHEHGSLPRARQDGIIRESVGDELLLYDQDSHTAHCLSPIAASVWRRCDGERDLAELAKLAGASECLVADALHELREKDLLESEPQLLQVNAPGISRREAISRVARYGAAAAAAPLIVSATAAAPAMASSIVWFCNPEPGSNCCLCNNECVANTKITKAECDKVCGVGKGFQENAKCQN